MSSMVALDGLTDDRLLGGRVLLFQPATGYRTAIDTILLAASIPARPGELVLEIGAGVGGAALCLAVRFPGIAVHGLEIQPDLVDIAKMNVDRNRAVDVTFHTADLLSPPADLPAAFDHVMANPPHLKATAARLSPNESKVASNVEGKATLNDFVSLAVSRLAPGGTVTFIHRFDRLTDLDAAFAPHGGAVTVFPLWRDGSRRDARRVLYRWQMEGEPKRAVADGLVLHTAGGAYTAEAAAVLQGKIAIDIGPT